MPTILAASGAAAVPNLPGQSLVPLLAGEQPCWREHLLTEFHTHAAKANFFPQRALHGSSGASRPRLARWTKSQAITKSTAKHAANRVEFRNWRVSIRQPLFKVRWNT